MKSLLSGLILLTSVYTSASLTTFSPNANHIFNTIHDSLRQWGSSLHHNGMSFFLATVPAGTQLYHGDPRADPVIGTEWLALEPEFAMYFAQSSSSISPASEGSKDGSQKPLSFNNLGEKHPGWLHTYVAAKDLRLLYLDGMSAARTTNGTLDTQDRILFNDTVFTGPMQDYDRGYAFCRMARETWGDRLDGFIRMSAGFEVILCSFKSALREIRVTQVETHADKPGRTGGASWLKSIASRYGGIGGDRVRPNLDYFTTAYSHRLNLFPEDDAKLPRLAHLPTEQLDPVRLDLNHLIMTHDAVAPSFNWQAITDLVVERYAHELRYLVSDKVPTLEQLHEETMRLLGPFIDPSARDTKAEADRCADQFIPAQAPEGLALHAVRSITRAICQCLLQASTETDHSVATKGLHDLMEYLSWAKWKECRGCADHEICIIPIWPMGTQEDYENPQCRDPARPNGEGRGYW